jgi:hypothetical protein
MLFSEKKNMQEKEEFYVATFNAYKLYITTLFFGTKCITTLSHIDQPIFNWSNFLFL